MGCATRASSAIVTACLLFMLLFPLFGGGSWGKDAFASLADKSFLHDKKAGVPVLMLTLPLLIAGSVASLSPIPTPSNQVYRVSFIREKLPSDNRVWIALFLFLPSLVYLLASMRRKMAWDMSTDTALSKSGNIFGMLAVVAMSWLLVPVSPKGPIGRLLAWDPIRVVDFHMWTGRIVIAASIIHGTEHTIRYALQGKDVFRAFYLPPLGCWKNPRTYKPEICDHGDDCTCYDHFLPITGLAALLGLVLIGLSSMYRIRRTNFAAFATLHYILAPLTFLAICIHYRRTVIYASSSLLYYLASNYPNWIESLVQKHPFGRYARVKLLSVEKLPSCGDSNNRQPRPCVALTIEASETTVQQWFPGAFLRLSVPTISKVTHPFTVNRVANQKNQVRVIFRATGRFTKALEKALLSRSSTTATPLILQNDDEQEEEEDEFSTNDHYLCTDDHSSGLPKLYVDGYYGSGRLLGQVLSHDLCVLVAAGIGITPYLGVISEFQSGNHQRDGLMTSPFPSGTRPKQIIVHWICRDRSLIEYCRKEYMDMDATASHSFYGENVSIKIIVHHTGEELLDQDQSDTTIRETRKTERVDTSHFGGEPFELSRFQVGQNGLGNLGYFFVFSIISWGGLYCLWVSFQKQGKEVYMDRIYSLIVITMYGLFVAILANLGSYLCAARTKKQAWSVVSSEEAEGTGYVETSDGVVELSTFQDDDSSRDASSPVDPVVSVEDPTNCPVMTLEVLQGRPNLENILRDLDDGLSPALFCCLPETLSKTLRDGVHRRNKAASGMSKIAVHQESFEI